MDYDIVVSGGGIAGLAAAAAFGAEGYSVLCLDPTPPVTDRDAEGADLRTTAFLQPAQAFLEDIGLWARLVDHAMPLQVMRIVDAGGVAPDARVTKAFNASDISDLPFGWNLPNWLLRREFLAHLQGLETVTFRRPRNNIAVHPRGGSPRRTERRQQAALQAGDRRRWPHLTDAKSRRDRGPDHPLWTKGLGLCSHPPNPA